MTDLTTDAIRKADLFTLFNALEMVLKAVRTEGREGRTECLALATQINDEISNRHR